MQQHDHIERTFAVGSAASIRIENTAGHVRVTGEERTDVVVTAVIDRRTAFLGKVDVPMVQQGDEIRVGPPRFEAGVGPEDTGDLGGILRSVLNAVRSEGHHGDARVDIDVRLPRTGVSVRIDQHAGRVAVVGVGRDVVIETKSGSIDVAEVRGDVRVESHAGRVQIERVTGAVEARALSGSIEVRDAGGPLQLSAGAGSISVSGRISEAVDVETGVGSIRLAVADGSRFFLDATTGVGTIRSELEPDELAAAPADAPRVRVRSGAGSIRISKQSRSKAGVL